MAAARTRLMGDPRGDGERRRDDADEPLEPGVIELRGVLGAGAGRGVGGGAGHADRERRRGHRDAGGRRRRRPPGGCATRRAVARRAHRRCVLEQIPIGEVLGWLVAAGPMNGDAIGPSVRWLGGVAIWAVQLTTGRSMVPLLRQRKRGSGGTRDVNGSYSVRWTPALINRHAPRRSCQAGTGLRARARAQRGHAPARSHAAAPGRSTQLFATARVASRFRRRRHACARWLGGATEALLSRLDGNAFHAAAARRWRARVARRTVGALPSARSAHAPTRGAAGRPTRRAWYFSVLAAGTKGGLITIEKAIANAGSSQGDVEDELARVSGWCRRAAARWQQTAVRWCSARTKPGVHSHGRAARRRRLRRTRSCAVASETHTVARVFADAASDSVVGANQLVNVRWTALFDDVELTAAEIAQLAKEARPLLRSRGVGSPSTRPTCRAAAVALAEQGRATQLSGAEMLRLALGLEGLARSPAVSRSRVAAGPPTCSRRRCGVRRAGCRAGGLRR